MRIIKYIFAIITFSVLFSSFPSKLFANENILYTENFEEDNLIPWEMFPSGTVWQIKDVAGSKKFGSYTNQPIEEAQTGDYSWRDYMFSVDITPLNNYDRNIFFRANPQRITYANLTFPYGYGLHLSPDYIDLQKYTQNMTGPDIPNKRYHLINDEYWEGTKNIKVVVQGNNIKVYYNNKQNPIIEYTDTDEPILSGRISLAHASGSMGHSEVYFDNVIISKLEQETDEFPDLNVPYYSQKNPAWKNDIYDHSQNQEWANSYYTVGNWGCALTSAAMILKYHGHDVDPKALNLWLIESPDGYLGNGYVNWNAISRYSLQHSNHNAKALEFERKPPTLEQIKTEIINGNPVIADVFDHFVVVDEITDSSFGIKDPAYEENMLLSRYGNVIKNLNTFTPSDTDLSYILIVSNNPNIKFYDQNGTQLNVTIYEEGVISNDEGEYWHNMEKIYSIQIPKPSPATYQVSFEGNGNYYIKYFAYNTIGNPVIASKEFNITNNKNYKFEINYDESPYMKDLTATTNSERCVPGIISYFDISYNLGKINKKYYFSIRKQLSLLDYYEKHKWIAPLKFNLKILKYQILHTPKQKINKNVARNIVELIDRCQTIK